MGFWGYRKNKAVRQPPTTPTSYPSGICVSTETSWYYLKGNKKFSISSPRVLASWGFPRIVESSKAAISKYELVGRLGFREGSLINDISNAKLYVISENKRRHITNPDVLERLGVRREDFMVVSATEANLHEDGEAFN